MTIIYKLTRNIIFGLVFISSFINAQNRENIWQLGIKTANPWPKAAINFNNNVTDTFSLNRPFGFFITNTGICDTSGNTLFYTDGVSIGNRNNDTLYNSTNYNPGYTSTINDQTLNILQAVVILPNPEKDSLYYIFHESAEQFNYLGSAYQPMNLKYSIVNMNLDNGNGGIDNLNKSIILFSDTLANGGLAACKHGNGSEWWLVMQKFHSNTYYKYLVTKDSIISKGTQVIGDSLLYNTYIQSAFSPDGSGYANISPANNLNIFRFDRCTGLFFDSTYIHVPNPTPGFSDNEAFGLTFSGNSRFLYVVLYSHIIQYDTWASNIQSSQTYVADWDTFNNPIATNFLSAQLAPDNRIYIGTYGSTFVLHYIEYPDSGGMSCNVVQNSFFCQLMIT